MTQTVIAFAARHTDDLVPRTTVRCASPGLAREVLGDDDDGPELIHVASGDKVMADDVRGREMAEPGVQPHLEIIPSVIWSALLLFSAIFLLRMLLTLDWFAGHAFTALFLGGASATEVALTAIIYGTFSFVAIRFGLLAAAAIVLFEDALDDMPASFDASA